MSYPLSPAGLAQPPTHNRIALDHTHPPTYQHPHPSPLACTRQWEAYPRRNQELCYRPYLSHSSTRTGWMQYPPHSPNPKT